MTGAFPGFDAKLRAACARWPSVQFDDRDFVAALRRRVTTVEQFDALHVADLFLAAACLAKHPRALEHFDALLERECAAVAGRARDLDAAELVGSLRARLLVEPRALSEFAGQSSLRSWLAAVVVRASLNQRRTQQRASAREIAQPEPHEPLAHPEFELLRARYRDAFADAFREALDTLEPKDRALLRLNVVDGLGLDRLARLRNVGRSTAARWLAAIREQLLEETRRALATRIGVGEQTVDSLLPILRSGLDVSLRTYLSKDE